MAAFNENIFLAFYDELIDIKLAVDNYSKQINIIKTAGDDLSDTGKLCYAISITITWGQIIIDLAELIPRLNEIIAYCSQYVTYYLSQIVIKFTSLIALLIKKITLTIQVKIAEITKNVVKAIANGKGPVIASSIASGAISAMQTIAQILNVVMQSIQTLLNAITGSLSVAAEGMCFFMTPKTLLSGGNLKSDISIANSNTSIVDRLPEATKLQMQNVVLATEQNNTAAKVSFIAANAALGAALAVAGSKIEVDPCVELSEINVKDIISTIETMLSVLTIPQALPKYEKLLITNVGFLLFLMTGFNSAGKTAFGIPGYP